MMERLKRLRDQTSSPDRVTARAAELLSAMPPLDTSRLRRRSLPREVGARVAGARIRPGVVLAVTLATVAAAAATLHSLPLPRVAGTFLGSATQASPAPASASPIRTGASANAPSNLAAAADGNAPSHVTGNPVADRVRPQPSAGVASSGGGGAATSETSRTAAKAPSSNVAVVAKTSPREGVTVEDESTLIVRAVRALRREGDPAHAQALAEQSLQRFPRGAQVEEAMELVMESAAARDDAGGAQRAASAYLDRFRSGRFADRAQRILASTAR